MNTITRPELLAAKVSSNPTVDPLRFSSNTYVAQDTSQQ
jgi:hypothetical protein